MDITSTQKLNIDTLLANLHCTACLRAAALAQGQRIRLTRNKLPKNNNCDLLDKLIIAVSTALTPNIKIGMNKGRINSDSNTPLRRDPKISEAPIDPIKLNVGVPRANAINKVL